MSNEDPPKIIIDEDWKSQVEAEKAAANAPADDEALLPDNAKAEAAASESDAAGTDEDPAMPPASFEMLLTGLATEAMMALGQFPHPQTGESTLRKNQAKYLIDTIEMLKDKTAGNLEAGESQAVESLLHQLRMIFIQATK